MTLVLNEIHGRGSILPPLIVAAGDRRISKPDGTYHSTRRKVFKVPRIAGAVSYFGLACFARHGREVYLSDWLPAFVARTSSATPETFSQQLFLELSRLINRRLLECCPSGFHICGFDEDGRPDFWFMSNIGDMTGFDYVDLRPSYFDPASHFLGRDAPNLGTDPKTGRVPVGKVQIYRNGDIRAHALVSEAIDRALTSLGRFPDFKLPKTSAEYGEYVRFKLEVIGYIYKKWARAQVIARPIDVFVCEGRRANA
jgi:hypothetical protein